MSKARTIRINRVFLMVVVFLFALIIAKLVYVGLSPVVDGVNIKEFADSRNTKKETIVANRGTIYDSNGEILAQNVNSYTVIAYLSESRTTDPDNPYHVVDKEKTAKLLAPIINMTEERILELLNYDAYQVELGPGGRGLTELVKEEIEALDLPGIDFIKSTKRYYPNADFLSYTIGYAKTDESNNVIGELGIELYYNEILTGKNGYKEYQSDMYGYQIANTEPLIEEAEDGNDIYLTIDTNIQMFVEQAMNTLTEYGVDWASISITNAKTGEILGISSSPSFDPNVKDIESYYDPFVSYTYEPGSTMKIFSFMAAIENGLYDGEELYSSGQLTIGEDKVTDWNTYGWGKISFNRGFYASSNVAATLLAQRLGRDKLKDFYESLGYGKITGINLPEEQTGVINFKYDIEVANAAFGQGMSVTPIQMVQALTSLANNGTVTKPYIVDKIMDGDEIVYEGKREEVRKVASPETIKQVLELMNGVVNSEDSIATGTSYKVDFVNLAGKTGTAQIASSSGGYMTGYYDNIRSFAGVFPYEDPEIIVYGVVRRLTDTSLLPESVKALVEDVSTYLNITSTDIVKEEGTYVVDSFINTSVAETKEDLKNNDFEVIAIGDGSVVIDQYPKKGTTINEKDKIFLLTNGTNKTYPDMTNWSRSDVTSFANLIGLSVTFDGYGYVKSTTAKTGETINLNQTLKVSLEPIYNLEESLTENDKEWQEYNVF